MDYGFDLSNGQNFVEFSATGSFSESTGILIGFENPEVVDPLNGTGMSSLLGSLTLTPEDRVQKYYFNEFVGNIAPKSAFFLADGGSTAFDKAQLDELKSVGEVSLPVPLSDTSYGEFSYVRHLQYDEFAVPSSLVTAWEFRDDLSGLNSASVYYVTKSEEGSYDWTSWKQNNNYAY